MSDIPNLPDGIQIPPFRPTGGKVLVQELKFKPSTLIEIVDSDKAMINEGIVVALSDCQYGRRKHGKRGWEHNGMTFPHEVSVGQRVFFEGTYQDSDYIQLNRIKYRALESWEIKGVLDAPQPTHFENAATGERQPDQHPLLIKV